MTGRPPTDKLMVFSPLAFGSLRGNASTLRLAPCAR
jgi:hypothetical protein